MDHPHHCTRCLVACIAPVDQPTGDMYLIPNKCDFCKRGFCLTCAKTSGHICDATSNMVEIYYTCDDCHKEKIAKGTIKGCNCVNCKPDSTEIHARHEKSMREWELEKRTIAARSAKVPSIPTSKL